MTSLVFKKFSNGLQRSKMIFKQCNRLHYISNRLQVNLNVGIQIQLWRVTTFHKMHCVIDYTFVVIDYQWTILKKKLRVITLNMIFSKVITLPMVSLTRHEESIKAWLWHTFNIYMIFFQTILFQNLSLTIAYFFFLTRDIPDLLFNT